MKLKSGLMIFLLCEIIFLFTPSLITQQSLPANDDELFEITTYNLTESWAFATGGAIMTSPAFIDINADRQLEIIFGSTDDYVYCVDNNGEEIWKYQTGNDIIASPAVADLNHDGYMDILVASTDGFLYCFDIYGHLYWRSFLNAAIYNDPMIVDLEFDGHYEILISNSIDKIFCLNEEGISIWNGTNVYYSGQSPAVGNIEFGPELEIIVPGTHGPIYFDYLGVNYRTDTNWDMIQPQDIVLADLNRTGINQVLFFNDDYTLVCINASNPTEYYWNYSKISKNELFSSPVVADVNDDGQLEIVIHAAKPGFLVTPDDGILYCFSSSGEQLWFTTATRKGSSQPIVADIDNDSSVEIITVNLYKEITCFDNQGTKIFTYMSTGNITNTPLIIDIDNDNILEITHPSDDGFLYCLEIAEVTQSGRTLWSREKCSTFNVAQADFDGDHIDDLSEEYFGTNPEARDTDADLLEDWVEIYTYRTNPNDADSDGDTIIDSEEVILGEDGYVTDPLNSDTDGDGYDDNVEIAAGTDPTDPNDNPSTTTTSTTNKTGPLFGGFVSSVIVLFTTFIIITNVERRKKY